LCCGRDRGPRRLRPPRGSACNPRSGSLVPGEPSARRRSPWCASHRDIAPSHRIFSPQVFNTIAGSCPASRCRRCPQDEGGKPAVVASNAPIIARAIRPRPSFRTGRDLQLLDGQSSTEWRRCAIRGRRSCSHRVNAQVRRGTIDSEGKCGLAVAIRRDSNVA
jgi:hypothetical protein